MFKVLESFEFIRGVLGRPLFISEFWYGKWVYVNATHATLGVGL